MKEGRRITKRVRYTSYFSEKHLSILKELAKEAGLPISYLVGNALDDYLIKIGRLSEEERQFAPIDKEWLSLRPEEEV